MEDQHDIVARRTWKYLTDLGSCQRHIIANLYAGGYYGKRGDPVACAVRSYLHERFGQEHPVKVSGCSAVVMIDRDYGVSVPLPAALQEFILRFDHKELRFLEDGWHGKRARRRIAWGMIPKALDMRLVRQIQEPRPPQAGGAVVFL